MIGILPAAGNATRIHGLPKFLLPIPDGYLLKRNIELMRWAKPRYVLVGSNPRNTGQISDYIDGNARVYCAENYETMTQTVLSATRKLLSTSENVGHSILFGLPDTYVEDDQCYAKLAAALADCDVAVATFGIREGQHIQGGMCRVLKNGSVMGVEDKPSRFSELSPYIWGALAWKPTFWQYLKPDMPHVGYALMPAIEDGLEVKAHYMDGGFWDCGTFERYAELIRTIT